MSTEKVDKINKYELLVPHKLQDQNLMGNTKNIGAIIEQKNELFKENIQQVEQTKV